jgi:diguanylate cyclase (GGDEF)-like protein
MDCETTRELISALIDEEISPEDRARLDDHLGGCPLCREELADLRRRDRAMRRTLAPWQAEAADFVARFRARLLGSGPLARCSVLVVDDKPEMIDIVSRILAHDFEVIPARTAAEGRQAFARRDISVVLSDQRMPGETGVQFLEWVARDHPRTVRLLMSGYADLATAIEAINRGGIYQFVPKPWGDNFVLAQTVRNAAEKFLLERGREELLAELRERNARLERRVTERTRELEGANAQLQRALAEMEKLALTDPLTGLPNRRAVEDIAVNELRRHGRYRNHLALGIIDVDRFKEINDRYLYPGGDYVLVQLTRLLSDRLRTVDSLGRIGGEEFLVVAPETTAEGAAALAERLRSAVRESPFEYNGAPIRVTVSIGFAVAEPDSQADFPRMKLLASETIHQAKEAGRDRVEVRRLPAAGPAPSAERRRVREHQGGMTP